MRTYDYFTTIQEYDLLQYIDDFSLSERNRALIMEFMKAEMSDSDLATKYGVSRSRFVQIIRNYCLQAYSLKRRDDELIKDIEDGKNPLDFTLDKLDLDEAKHIVHRLGAGTIGELIEKYPTMNDLLNRRGIGKEKAKDIQEALKKYGLELK